MPDSPVPTRLAASVVVVAPVAGGGSAGGYQVLMVKRSAKSSFMSNLSVFPGGVHEKCDAGAEWRPLCYHSPKAKKWPTSPLSQEQSLRVAGTRELFEETGVLSLKTATGDRVLGDQVMSAADVDHWRRAVHDDATKFYELCSMLGAGPDLDMPKLAQWITPKAEKKRFDTHFYVVALPGQVKAEDDGAEVTNAQWQTARDYLSMMKKKEISFAPPQYYMLTEMVHLYPTLEQLVSSDIEITPYFPLIQPGDDSTIVVHCPGDEGHPEYRGEKGARNRIVINAETRAYRIISDRLPDMMARL